jgi:hypothetical protein
MKGSIFSITVHSRDWVVQGLASDNFTRANGEEFASRQIKPRPTPLNKRKRMTRSPFFHQVSFILPLVIIQRPGTSGTITLREIDGRFGPDGIYLTGYCIQGRVRSCPHSKPPPVLYCRWCFCSLQRLFDVLVTVLVINTRRG